MYISKTHIKNLWITTLLSLKAFLSYDIIEKICKIINNVSIPENLKIKINFTYLPNEYIDLLDISIKFEDIFIDSVHKINTTNIDNYKKTNILSEIESSSVIKFNFDNFKNNKDYLILYETNNNIFHSTNTCSLCTSNRIFINIKKNLLITDFNDDINQLLEYITKKINVIYYIYEDIECKYIIEKPFIINGINYFKPDGNYITNIIGEDEDNLYLAMKLLFVVLNKNKLSII